jgi:AcrR family transcriptional regulator
VSIEKKMDPRVKRTRQLLKDALVSLIRERELDKLTIQDIAERATLNRATFYLHFRDLDDLKEQIMDDILVELFKIVSSDTNVKPKPVFATEQPAPQFIAMLEHLSQNAALYTVMLEKNSHFQARMFGVIIDIISLGSDSRKAAGQTETVPIEILAASFLGVLTWWLREGMPYTPNYLAEQLSLFRIKGPFTQTDLKTRN